MRKNFSNDQKSKQKRNPDHSNNLRAGRKQSKFMTSPAYRRTVTVLVSLTAVLITINFYILSAQNYLGMDIVFYAALLFTVIILAYLVICNLKAKGKYAKLAKVLHRCYVVCLVIGFSVFCILQGLIFSGYRPEDAEVDCVIVLGAGLHRGHPSRILVSRLDTAIEYLTNREDIPIIVSGGLGSGESITEAEAMFRYLRNRGIDENIIWKEEQSTSTLENLTFSIAIMEEIGLDTSNAIIAIVSNDFHLYRAKYIAGKLGVESIGVPANTPIQRLRVLYHFREALALSKDILLLI